MLLAEFGNVQIISLKYTVTFQATNNKTVTFQPTIKKSITLWDKQQYAYDWHTYSGSSLFTGCPSSNCSCRKIIVSLSSFFLEAVFP